MTCSNPVIYADFPDPDIIRVDDTWYMASTTMHFMPGAVILRSFDLAHWEIISHVYESIEDYPAARLENDQSIYGSGMWAPSLRHHRGRFYLMFTSNDLHKTCLYTARNIEGPWRKQNIEGFYYDPGLFFEGNRAFVLHGNTHISITELTPKLSGPLPGGIDRRIISDREDNGLGFEGSHLYKIRGKYYAFFIHWPRDGSGRRTQVCYMADSLEGPWEGFTVLDDDIGWRNAGVAQGGIVDTPDGRWFAMLFQDRGAAGRMPVLVPVSWDGDKPVFGPIPQRLEIASTRPGHRYEPLFANDDFMGTIITPKRRDAKNGNEKRALKPVWEWNHLPSKSNWSLTRRPGSLMLKTAAIVPNITRARNTLTQRVPGPCCEVSVTVDASEIKEGDWCGLSMFQSNYAFIGLTRRKGILKLGMVEKEAPTDGKIPPKELPPVPLKNDFAPGFERALFDSQTSEVSLMMRADFRNAIDLVSFYFKLNGGWVQLGGDHQLHFLLDHFCGCRAGLFMYSTQKKGGRAWFKDFRIRALKALDGHDDPQGDLS